MLRTRQIYTYLINISGHFVSPGPRLISQKKNSHKNFIPVVPEYFFNYIIYLLLSLEYKIIKVINATVSFIHLKVICLPT